jgi:hypothetical protein
MPSLAEHKSEPVVKMLYIGDSGSGKTGSLTSLVKAGYKLRIMDYDNGVGTLASFVKKECPDRIGNVSFIPLRDKLKLQPSSEYAGKKGPVVTTPTVFTQTLELLEKWDDGSNPAEWGAETVLVLDSLSALGRAVHNWAKSINRSQPKPNPDKRSEFFTAQQGLENVVELVASEAFNTNVIVISHVRYEEPKDEPKKGYVNAIGSALGPILPRYFNTLIQAESTGIGKAVKRKIRTLPTGVIDLKTPVSHSVEAEYPLETGLATLFEQIKAAS